MIFKKLAWAIKRHPFLYKTRFKLLSRDSTLDEISLISYNSFNTKDELPHLFHDTNRSIFPEGRPVNDWATVCKMVSWFLHNLNVGPGLSESSSEALKKMLNGHGGVCSDKVQVFNNFCVINDIQVREWGSTRIPFDKHYTGHSFNEVFSKEMNKWVLIDPSYGIFFSLNDEPLSVMEYKQAVKRDDKLFIKYLNGDPVVEESLIKWIYLHKSTVPFLISNYSNRTYDKFLKFFRPIFPIFVIHFILFMIGRSYYYMFPIQELN